MVEGRSVIINFTFCHACISEQAAPFAVYYIKQTPQRCHGLVRDYPEKRRGFDGGFNGGLVAAELADPGFKVRVSLRLRIDIKGG